MISEAQKLSEISGVIFGTTGGVYSGVLTWQSTGILLFMTVLPCALMLVSYFLYRKKYKLDEEEYDRICGILKKNA